MVQGENSRKRIILKFNVKLTQQTRKSDRGVYVKFVFVKFRLILFLDRRGNPLYLCPDRYRKLEKLWLNHSVAEEVAHCLESNRNLLSIDWTNL